MSANEIKAMRDTTFSQMELALKRRDRQLYWSVKERYSQLCDDYFDATRKTK